MRRVLISHLNDELVNEVVKVVVTKVTMCAERIIHISD